MTPRQVDELSNAEFAAFTDYAQKVSRDQERASRRASKGRRR